MVEVYRTILTIAERLPYHPILVMNPYPTTLISDGSLPSTRVHVHHDVYTSMMIESCTKDSCNVFLETHNEILIIELIDCFIKQ